MEVHAHTHTESPPAGRAGKKFTHYLWEFIMLFLAVFCGFLAENFREHQVEHQRGRQYASTMLEDLKADKEALEAGIRINKSIVRFIDTLLAIYLPDNKQTKTSAQLYYYGRYALRFWYYVSKQVTLEQMKHSGTIRYFQNSSLEKQQSTTPVISEISGLRHLRHAVATLGRTCYFGDSDRAGECYLVALNQGDLRDRSLRRRPRHHLCQAEPTRDRKGASRDRCACEEIHRDVAVLRARYVRRRRQRRCIAARRRGWLRPCRRPQPGADA